MYCEKGREKRRKEKLLMLLMLLKATEKGQIASFFTYIYKIKYSRTSLI